MTLRIPARFNGPLQSGNGGYSAGAVAAQIEGPAEVTLRSPVPLDTPLSVERDGNQVRVLDAATLIAEASPAPDLEVGVPDPVGQEPAREASRRYGGPSEGPFSRCFVCGRTREDSLGVFAGRVEGRELVASPWTPPVWTADEAGRVLPEFVWAVLDCPTFFAAYPDQESPVSVLAQIAVRIEGPVAAGEEHVVIAWPLGVDSRKRHAGSALLSAEGEVLAAARALMIEPRGR